MKLLSVLDHSARLRSATPLPGPAGPIDLARLAARIEREGIDAVTPEVLADLARRGRAVGLSPEVAAIVADPAAPAVVRARAFGLIHRRLAARPIDTDPNAIAA